jgi:tRNA pseudouridine38-40 synthase
LIAKLTISYDGSRFYGSQIQLQKDTVHGRLSLVLTTLGIDSKIVFSGRTDKNVHATHQVVSFELPTYWHNIEKLKDKFISFLPNSIKVQKLEFLNTNFHARFSAKKRSYRYIISKTPLTSFNSAYMSYHKHINTALIVEACREFVGKHDFEFFHKKGSEPHTTIREIYDIKFYPYKDSYIFKFTANSYLRSQIRMMIYMILEISSKNLTIDDLREQLQRKKQHTKQLAPASGLYLSKVYYLH